MPGFVRHSFRWVARHAIPAVAVTLVAGAAVGGGITYAMTSTAAPTAAATTPGAKPAIHAPRRAPAPAFAAQVVAIVTKDTGLSLATIKSDLAAGQSLDTVAGANATKLENDIVNALITARQKRMPKAMIASRLTKLETRLHARVHALMAEPGTQLLQQLQIVRGSRPATNAPQHRFHTPASPSPSAAA